MTKKIQLVFEISVLSILLIAAIFSSIYPKMNQICASASTENLASDTYTVNLRKQSYVNLYIDASAHPGSTVEGSISVTGGQINFYVFDADGWDRYQLYDPTSISFGGPYGTEQDYFERQFSCQVFAKLVNSYSFSFAPSQTDHYYFVFDNRYNNDWQTNKQVSLNVDLSYDNPTSNPTAIPSSEQGSNDFSMQYVAYGAIVTGVVLGIIAMVGLLRSRK